MRISGTAALILFCALAGCSNADNVTSKEESSSHLVRHAVFARPGSGAPEVSTNELEQILQDRSAVVPARRRSPQTS
jgi:hypothetical protein